MVDHRVEFSITAGADMIKCDARFVAQFGKYNFAHEYSYLLPIGYYTVKQIISLSLSLSRVVWVLLTEPVMVMESATILSAGALM